jgi:7-cyano-7-deazaguanine reductase
MAVAANNLSKLGKDSAINFDGADANILEKINNPHLDYDYNIRFTCLEFTSICPVTSQPDFAHIFIDYLPNKYLVESKSLKLYLTSYRNHGAFHEDCTIKIAKDLIKLLDPKWFRIAGFWYPRGGIPIDIFYENGTKPKDFMAPDLPDYTYKAR